MGLFLSLLGACIVNHDLYQERLDALTDNDGDGLSEEDGDCNDADPTVFPGADERCNELDDDCDAEVDEGAADATRWYPDADEDGYGSEADVVASCEDIAGWLTTGGDCDDTDAAVSPDGAETCNSTDDDCDGIVDNEASDARAWYPDRDGDGYGDPEEAVLSCSAPSGMVADARDCDDTNGAVSPEAEEICNDLIDNNCSGFFSDCQWDSIISVDDGIQIIGVDYVSSLSKGVTVADIDGDGVTEVILNVKKSNDVADVRAYEFSMDQDLTFDDSEIVWGSGRSSDSFGIDIESADWNGDGFDDLFVTEDDYTEVQSVSYVLLGPISSGFNVSSETADMMIGGNGEIAPEVSIHSIDDISGDGVPEFGVSSCVVSAFPVGGCQPGEVAYLFSTVSEYGLESAHITVEDTDGYGFGAQMLGPDMNGDGVGELVISAMNAQPERGESNYDSVFAFEYSTEPVLYQQDDALISWYGCSTCVVSLLDSGDLNADGYEDLVLGMYQKILSYNEASEIVVIFGAESTSSGNLTASGMRILAEDVDPLIGSTALITDMNNDGLPDIVFGGLYFEERDVYVVYGGFSSSGVVSMNDYDVEFNYTIRSSGAINDYWGGIMAADLDNDLDKDLILSGTTYAMGSRVYVLPGIVQ